MSKGNGIIVEVRNHKNKEDKKMALEEALKKFKRKIKKSNLMLEIFEKEYYVKPSTKKRQKKLKAKARNKYDVKKQKRIDNNF